MAAEKERTDPMPQESIRARTVTEGSISESFSFPSLF